MNPIMEVSPVSYTPAIYTDATQQVNRSSSINGLPIGRQEGFRRSLQSAAQAARRPDDATLSTAGTLLARALRAPDVRMDKVAALQQSIRSGSYRVPASVLAEKMMGSLAA